VYIYTMFVSSFAWFVCSSVCSAVRPTLRLLLHQFTCFVYFRLSLRIKATAYTFINCQTLRGKQIWLLTLVTFFSEFNFLLADWVIYILRSCVIFEYQKIIVKERKAHKSSNGYRMLMLQSRGRYSNLNSISEFPRQQTGYLD